MTFGRMKPEKAYELINGVRDAFHVGALGLGVTDQIKMDSSLLTIVTVEAFCNLLAFIVFVHECVNLSHSKHTHDEDDEHTSHSLTHHTIYLSFRLSCIVAGTIGAALITDSLTKDTHNAVETTIGTMLMSLGIFASHALGSSKPKSLQKDDINKLESLTEEEEGEQPPSSAPLMK